VRMEYSQAILRVGKCSFQTKFLEQSVATDFEE
jgi:hypothetical protein